MTGEMYSIDKNGEEPDGTIWSLHAAIAKHFGGQLSPFDKYQGPEIYIPKDEYSHSLWIISDFHENESYVYDKITERRTSFFNNTLPDDFIINLVESEIINPTADIKSNNENDDDKPSYYIDIPNPNNIEGEWINVGTFETKQDAIKYAKENLGADDNGNINVISQ